MVRWPALAGLGFAVGAALGASGVASSVARAEVIALESVIDVRALCAELAAAPDDPRTFALRLPSTAFDLGAYDAARSRLPIDPRRFGAPGVGYELVLGTLAGGGPPAGIALAIPTSAAEAAKLRRAHKLGELVLELRFRAARPRACATRRATPTGTPATTQATPPGVRLAIELRGFTVARKGQVIVTGGQLDDDPLPAVEPRLELGTPWFTGARGAVPEPVVAALAPVLAPIETCRTHGEGVGAVGSIVVGLAIDAGGTVTDARPELDGIGAPALAECVARTFARLRLPLASTRLSVPVRFIVDR